MVAAVFAGRMAHWRCTIGRDRRVQFIGLALCCVDLLFVVPDRFWD